MTATTDRLAGLRIQDPVLTKLAQGYYNNELVCESLMPIVNIGKEGGKNPQFGRESFLFAFYCSKAKRKFRPIRSDECKGYRCIT